MVALTGFRNAELLAEQVAAWSPGLVGLVDDQGRSPEASWRTGRDFAWSMPQLPGTPDIVLNAVVGAAGLDATLAALEHGKRVALANKESLVMAGKLVLEAMRRGGGELVPIDSEHSAVWQCIAGRPQGEMSAFGADRIGRPVPRLESLSAIAGATVHDALRHPTWRMGRKITVDSATLANKALEVIEAHFLFGVSYDQIEVVVHPQSIVHSFVELVDGSVLAQLGVPSMELPILYSLTHPARLLDTGVPRYDPTLASPLTFEPVRLDAFPALGLGIEAGRCAGAAPAVFNAANEQAVALFLAGEIPFGDISRAIGAALDLLGSAPGDSREAILGAAAAARRLIQEQFAC